MGWPPWVRRGQLDFQKDFGAKRYKFGRKEHPTNMDSHLYTRNAWARLNHVKRESDKRAVVSFG